MTESSLTPEQDNEPGLIEAIGNDVASVWGFVRKFFGAIADIILNILRSIGNLFNVRWSWGDTFNALVYIVVICALSFGGYCAWNSVHYGERTGKFYITESMDDYYICEKIDWRMDDKITEENSLSEAIEAYEKITGETYYGDLVKK